MELLSLAVIHSLVWWGQGHSNGLYPVGWVLLILLIFFGVGSFGLEKSFVLTLV